MASEPAVQKPPTWEQLCHDWQRIAESYKTTVDGYRDIVKTWESTFRLMCLNVVLFGVVGFMLGRWL